MKKFLTILFSVFLPLSIMAIDYITWEVSGIKYKCCYLDFTATVISQTSSDTEIVIPDKITPDSPFWPFTVTGIGGGAFYGCSNLTSITIPSTVTSIESWAFYNCSGLTSITIPESVTSIGEEAFRDCSGLTSINIPESVTSIGNNAFSGCSGLTSITVDEGNTVYDSRENCNAIIETSTNKLIRGCTNTTIPSTVTSAGGSAFSGCTGLPVENNIRYADTYLVEAVDKTLSNYQIKKETRFIGGSAFSGCKGMTSITLPESVMSIGGSAFSGCTGLESINIPEGVTSIENSAFYGCSGLTSINIPEGVTSIENGAFYGCSGLTSINIPEGVTSIGEYAFRSCYGLTSVTIPENVTSIGQYAFERCNNITSIVIPENVTSIGNGAFSDCTGLESISVEVGNTVYDSRENCNAIIETSTNTLIQGCVNTTILSTVTSIGNRAFYGCTGLTSVTIPSTLTSIGNQAFVSCTGLTSVTIPESVTSIGNYAFYDCSGLTSVTISSSVTSIGNNYTFSGVGTYSNPCVLYVPDGFDFGGVNTSGDYFLWKGGYFKLPTETTITISSAGVGTFCYDKDLDFSSVNGLKAYVAVGYNKSTGNVIVVEVKDVPASTGLYLKGTPGTYQVPFGSSSSYYTNMLVGTTASTTINATDGSMTNFILYNGTNGIGFYTFNNSYTMGANKAYLQIPTSMVSSSSSANYLGIEFEEGVTGIDNVHSATEQAEWYSLDGRRLNSKPTQKGVYIVNGKKVVVK